MTSMAGNDLGCSRVPVSGQSQFYHRLPSFSEFRDITDDRHFTRAPDDWFVVITDVKGSTKAIEAGRYKDVNTIGAASISVVQETLKEDFPYVFGGDGATLLIPPDSIETVLERLMQLERLSRENFDLGLRVGCIPVKEVHESDCRIEVAKHELAAGKCVAVFRGGGLVEAEKRIKGDEEKYCRAPGESEDIDLTGLSCRWKPLPNKRGCILSLLVQARNEPTGPVYQEFLERFNEFFEGVMEEANPVNTGQIRYRSVKDCLDNETRFHSRRSTWGFFKRFCEIVAAVLIFKYRIPPLIFNAPRYRDSMRPHSDYRKFDDMLRMIVDCSPLQVDAIRAYLKQRFYEGEIFYGIHESEEALMTCYVQDVKDGEHIHFIDGGDGGYAMAAKELKAQMKAAD